MTNSMPPTPASVQAPDALDLSQCDRLEVRFPGAIMPHGAVLLLSAEDDRIVGASANTETWFGLPPDRLFGETPAVAIGTDAWRRIAAALLPGEPAGPPHPLGRIVAPVSGMAFDVFADQSKGLRVIDFEAVPAADTGRSTADFFLAMHRCVAALKAAKTWEEGMAITARELKALTGYERAMGMHFLEDGSFRIVAEACEPGLPSFLDKRFPRSDIPEPGRQQMLTLPYIYAPDMSGDSVPLLMGKPGVDPGSVDLGRSVLRALSPVCNRYYANLGVRSRIVLPIVRDGRLWGFLSCWNSATRPLGHDVRLACQSLAETAGLLLGEKQDAQGKERALAIKRQIATIAAELATTTDLTTALEKLPSALAAALDAGGVAIALDGRFAGAGSVPDADFLQQLVSWLNLREEALFASDHLPEQFGLATGWTGSATGLVAARLPAANRYLLLFRPEWVHEVKWAGNPDKPVEIDPVGGQFRLTPRGSFEEWKQEVRGRARPWAPEEAEAAADIRQAVLLAEGRLAVQKASEAKSRFLASMSQEIRAPLDAIVSMAGLMRKDGVSARQADQLGNIDIASERLLGVISDVLDLSLLEAGRMPLETLDFSLSEVTGKLLSALSPLALKKNLGLHVELDPKVPPVLRGDPQRIGQALFNYASNAVKGTGHGWVRIGVTLEQEAGDRLLLRFEVADTGKSRGTDVAERLFSLDGNANGFEGRNQREASFKLAITRHLARLMGGDAGATANVEQGNSFWFTAWLARGDQPAATVPEPGEQTAFSAVRHECAGMTVLVVDDEPINQLIAAEILEDAGLRVDTADNGVEAVAKAASGQFALVLMDMQMPEIDGPEAARRIKARHPDLPIIGLTGNSLKEDLAECLAAGMAEVHTKPIDSEKLMSAILAQLRQGPRPQSSGQAESKSSTTDRSSPRAFPIIDPEVLWSFYSAHPNTISRLVNAFVSCHADSPQHLRALAAEKNHADIARIAHDIRGAAGYFKAALIGEEARHLEDLARDEHPDTAASAQQFADLLDRMLDEVRQLEKHD